MTQHLDLSAPVLGLPPAFAGVDPTYKPYRALRLRNSAT